MDRGPLLPGVSDDFIPPAVVFDSRRALRRARLRAAIVDVLQVAFLAGVDYVFIRFPQTHIPFGNRHASLLLVAVANVAMLTYLFLARAIPRFRARRVAGTWSRTERSRFAERK